MLRAIIFDCDGVIVDSEPHHFKAFQQILSEEGISFTKEEYFKNTSRWTTRPASRPPLRLTEKRTITAS
jgi:beta-phosphoglucomutase-like phosphatase (HAD superfamily)